ncbi:MAG: MFS transporter [Actinobacteria bacterium]|nr:MFS transporter [Actinomycetota bacterium]
MNPVKTLRSLGPRYTALWVGQTISQFGTYVAVLTIPLLIDYIQESRGIGPQTLDFSIAYALEFAPTFLVGLAAGVLLDRLHLRPVMIATDLLRACAFFYLAAEVGNYGMGTVFVMAFVLGSMTTLFDGALYSMIPAIVPRDRLSDANSWVTASIQANFAIGPAVAGLFAWLFAGPAVGLFINGLTFVISAISLAWVGRVPHHRSREDERVGFLTEAANGIKYVFGEPRLRVTTIASAIPNFVIGFFEATIVVLAEVVLLTETDLEIGILLSAMGAGGVVGALVSPRVTRRLGLGRAMTAGMALTGVCMLALMFTTYGLLAIALQAGWMIGVSVINVPLATIRQHYAKESMLGRVITASRAIGWATLPLGAVLGGWLGATPETYPWVARSFPLLMVATAIWLATTVVWGDTFGPDFRGIGQPNREPAAR